MRTPDEKAAEQTRSAWMVVDEILRGSPLMAELQRVHGERDDWIFGTNAVAQWMLNNPADVKRLVWAVIVSKFWELEGEGANDIPPQTKGQNPT